MKWLALAFRIDDQFDEDTPGERPAARSAAVEILCGVLHGLPASPDFPSVRALGSLWRETSAGQPPNWRRAFVGHLEDCFRSYATEADLDARGVVPDLDEYLRMRFFSIGMPWLWDLDELRLPHVLSDDVRACAPMEKLRRAAALHIGLVNDVYSVSRESRVGYRYNVVSLLRDAQGCSFREAVDQVVPLVAERARAVLEAQEELVTELDSRCLSVESRTAALDYSGSRVEVGRCGRPRNRRYARCRPASCGRWVRTRWGRTAGTPRSSPAAAGPVPARPPADPPITADRESVVEAPSGRAARMPGAMPRACGSHPRRVVAHRVAATDVRGPATRIARPGQVAGDEKSILTRVLR